MKMADRRIRKMSADEAWRDFQKSATPKRNISKGRKTSKRSDIRKRGRTMNNIRKESTDSDAMMARIDQNLQSLVDALPKIESIYTMLNTEEEAFEEEPIEGEDVEMEEDIPIEPEFEEEPAEDEFDEEIELSDDKEEFFDEDDYDDEDESPEGVDVEDTEEDEMVDKTGDETGTDEVPRDEVKINQAKEDEKVKKARKKGKVTKTARPKGIQKAQDARKDDGVSVKDYLSQIGRVDPSEFKAPIRRN